MVFSSSLPHHVLLLNVVSIHEVLPITRKVMKKKRSFSAQKPFRKRLVGQVLVMFCGPLFELHRLDGLRMLLFFCRSNFVESSTYHNLISMLCWRVLDICDIHPYSVFCCFALSCFVSSFKMGTTYSRNATEILESDHQDLVSFTGGLLFQSFVNITAKFLSHILLMQRT